jgi:hypothetical protein
MCHVLFGLSRKFSTIDVCLILTNVPSLTHITLTADIISTVEFDHTGNFLATGDKGGRVVLFERNEGVSNIGKILFLKGI